MAESSLARRYTLLLVGVVLVGLVGFSTFLYYLNLDLAAFAVSGLPLLGVAAGAASFFSPCSFPLLLTLLSRETAAAESKPVSTGRALQFAVSLAFGVSAFLLLAGAAIAAGSGPLLRQITFTSIPGRMLRVAAGLLLVSLGLVQIRGIRLRAADRLKKPLLRAQARLRRTSPPLGFALFGFGYVLAGFG